MKRLIIFVFGFILILLYSCSKEMIGPDQSGDLKDLTCGKGGLHKQSGPVFTVPPSEDATQALIDAFAAAKEAGPGAVVQLEEGTYTIGMIEVRDFDGYFQGAGKGKTIITNLPDLPCEECWEIDIEPYLLQFVSGNVTVSDMTISLKDGKPCAYGEINYSIMGDALASMLTLADYTSTYVPENRYMKGVVKNVDFIPGDIGDGLNVYGARGNASMSLYCGSPWWFGTGAYTGPTHGKYLISDCRFERSVTGPDAFGLDDKSMLTIENNYISEMAFGMYLGGIVGAKVVIRNNNIQNSIYMDMYVDDNDFGTYPAGILKQRSEYSILNNCIQTLPGATSIYMSDSRRTYHPEEGYPQLIDVHGNIFNTQEGSIAILGLNNVDAKIWNNRFSGTGSIGVMLEGDETTETYAENIKIMGNNFMKANYTEAAISLGAYTKNCTVVGVPTDMVVDLGVNNKIIGVKAQRKGPHYEPGMHGQFRVIQQNIMKMKPVPTL